MKEKHKDACFQRGKSTYPHRPKKKVGKPCNSIWQQADNRSTKGQGFGYPKSYKKKRTGRF